MFLSIRNKMALNPWTQQLLEEWLLYGQRHQGSAEAKAAKGLTSLLAQLLFWFMYLFIQLFSFIQIFSNAKCQVLFPCFPFLGDNVWRTCLGLGWVLRFLGLPQNRGHPGKKALPRKMRWLNESHIILIFLKMPLSSLCTLVKTNCHLCIDIRPKIRAITSHR